MKPRFWNQWAYWVIGYVVVVVAIIWGVRKARDWAMLHLNTPESIAEWQAWRDDVRKHQQQPDGGSVRRRVPSSAEPPALILMRDYFGVSLVGGLLFGSALYWVLAWFFVGASREYSSDLNGLTNRRPSR